MTSKLLIQPDAMTAPKEWPPAELALNISYELDPFQKHAILGIHAGDHVFVTAKTGSGKTLVGEYLIAHALASGKRVFYTTPIKSLSNQKYYDLKKRFPNASVGILTGDIKMQPDAQIIVMTAEILRNLFFKRGTATEGVGLTAAVSLENVAGVVMDEVHYIQDPDRGHVWEETLILCPPELKIQLVLLSATMPSAAALASWLAELHQRRVWLLSTTYRIVPLVHGLLTEGSTSVVAPMLDSAGRWTDAYELWKKARAQKVKDAENHKRAVEVRKADGYTAGPPTSKVRVEDPVHILRRTVKWLEEKGAMPALFFVFSRKECERYAKLVEGSLLDSSEAATAAHILDFHLSRWRSVLEHSPQYHTIRDLLVRGIAFHHSGLLPLLKEAVEILFTRGFVRVLFATETFSVGLNMPTKTVVFLEMEKYSDGGERRLLRPDEYIQMAGRAGRRGIDTQGTVLYQPLRNPVDNADLRRLLTGALPPLESRMRFHYDFLLKTRLSGSSDIAEKSYWAIQQKGTRDSLALELQQIESKLATTTITEEERAEWEEGQTLEKAFQTSRKKAADLALKRWKDAHKEVGRWKIVHDACTATQALLVHRDRLAMDIEKWDSSPLLNLEPLESCLTKWGLLHEGTLTERGIAATEVNEGHPILMQHLAASGYLAEASAYEVIAILASFLQEAASSDAPSLDSIGLSQGVLDILYWLDKEACSMQRDEDAAHVVPPHGFWNLSSMWVGIVWDWLGGLGLAELANRYEMFEGNLQRGLQRVANLLEEWIAIATLRRDLPMLEKLNGVSLFRDELVVDSLYMRL
jgi:superfamily II RNA helicase